MSAVDGTELLCVEGRLAKGETATLLQAVREGQARSSRLSLDLTGLTFVDAAGAAVLRELAARDVAIHGASTYVHQLLDRGPHA
jgi:ABC-type transporter Mla MlaB component